MTKSKFGSKWLMASIAAIALSTGVASAEDRVRIDAADTVDGFKASDAMDAVSFDVSIGEVVESASIDVTFTIDELGAVQDVEPTYSAKGGWTEKVLKLVGKVVGDLFGGGGGGGSGGGGQTCNVNVNIEGGTQGGTVNVSIGNLNCGTQTGGSGGGNSGGGK